MKKLFLFVFSLFLIGNTLNSQISHWKFEDNANDETGTNNGTLVNGDASLYVEGVSGKALDFGAGNDSTHVLVPDNASIDFDSTQSFSVSLFLKVETLTPGGRIFVKGSSNKDNIDFPTWNGKRYEMYISNGRIRWAVDDDVKKAQLSVDNAADYMNLNDWNHLVGVRDRADSMMYLYINGKLAGEMEDKAAVLNISTDAPLIIGKSEYLNTDGTPGLIDEFSIYNTALTPAEINTLYRTYMPVPADLAGYWKFDLDETDETGVNDGDLINGGDSLYVEGVAGAAIDFGAGNDSAHVLVPDNASIDFDSTQSFSVSLFLKVETLTPGGRIFVKGSSNKDNIDFPTWNGKRYEMYISNGRIRWAVDDDVKKAQLSVDNAADYMNLNDWNHLVGVRDRVDSMMYLYINGKLAGEMEDKAAVLNISTDAPLIIGKSEYLNTDGTPGLIDEFRIYTKALDASEIQEIYRKCLPVPADITGYWKFDLDAKDETGVNDGTLINGGDSLYVSGHVGAAVDFGAGNDSTHILVPDNPSIDFDSTTSFTVSFLLKDDDFTASRECVFKGATGSDGADKKGKWYAIGMNGSELRIFIDDNVNKSQLGFSGAGMLMHKDSWNHVVGVRDLAQDSLFLFINGVQVASMLDITDGNIASDPLPLIIGNSQNYNSNNPGLLDEIRLYNVALSAAEIAALTAEYGIEPKPPAPDGVVAWWKLDGDATDVLGTSNGTLENGDASLWVAGHIGQAIDFGAGNDSTHILVPNNSIIDLDSTTSFTISFLLNDDDFTASRECIFKGATGSDGADKKGKWYAIGMNGSELRIFIDDNVNKSQLGFSGAGMLMHKDSWNHVVGVRDLAQDSLFLFINGVQVASMLDITDGNIASDPLPLIIGNSQNYNSNNPGLLDEIRIYNVALSPTEIAALTAEYGIEPVQISVIRDVNSSSGLTIIYPNPVTNRLFIESENEISRVTIYGIDGRIMSSVLNVNSKATTLNTNELNSGLYIIQIVSVNNDVISNTFIKK